MNTIKRQYGQEIKGHLLTGISWMIPLIVAAGICIALGQVIGVPTSVNRPAVSPGCLTRSADGEWD